MAIRPIFWTGSADCVSDYLVANKRLQAISSQHPLYILYSGEDGYLRRCYPDAVLVPCQNEWKAKACKVFSYLKERDDFDVVIRFCPDAVIKDVTWLLQLVEQGMCGRFDVAVGNKAFFADVWYLRGACNATPRSVVGRMSLVPSDRDYDTWYSLAVEAAGGKLNDWPLFEINNRYTGKCPVWHPTQYDNGHRDMAVRFQTFLKEC